MRILIANRGEIARRVIRTAHRLGHETVAVFADPDEAAPFVGEATTSIRLGPAPLAESYLSSERILAVAEATAAAAIHPGYGFLSENAGFARAVVDAGLVWIGPSADVIDRMGSKIEARRLATTAGVPVIPGFDRSQDDEALAGAAAEIGYPILVKAAAGGGGKGIRVAAEPEGFARALDEARAEAERSFGDTDVIVERFVERPRHVEVQVVGDRHGAAIHLGTRECSVQRRYQKVLEEAPAPNLAPETRSGLTRSATDLARSIGYDSTGTVEFIVDDASGEFFFLEMNTRLQVEHPVTEAITGLDLVELQLEVADGGHLPLTGADVGFAGHAIEARINAEDVAADFAPQPGTITRLAVPVDVRWDSGIEAGSVITSHYDPMVAKLIVHADDRPAALRRLAHALDDLLVGGLTTNAGLHRWLVDQPAVVEGRVTTRFLDEVELPLPDREAAADAAARAWAVARDGAAASDVWHALASFRLTPHRPTRTVHLRGLAGRVHDIRLGENRTAYERSAVDFDRREVVVNVGGQPHTFTVLSRSDRFAPDASTGHGHAAAIVAPFPAVVSDVLVTAGQAVAGGEALVVIEAMKMLHTLAAAGPGTVAEVRVAPGDQVATDQVLVTFDITDAHLGGDR